MSTPHNSASPGDIAKTVLMPGDPLRSKFVAETYLDNPVLVNNVRGIQGYTGTYKGVPVSVMASGMGIPSIGIYSYELFKFYDVDNIIRIGSAGSYVPELKIYDVVLATEAYSESTFARTLCGYSSDMIKPSDKLVGIIRQVAKENNINLHETITHSSDVFYHQKNDYMEYVKNVKHCGIVEMEAYGLFANAMVLGKNAASILTVSDSFVTKEETTSEERRAKLLTMAELALETAVALHNENK